MSKQKLEDFLNLGMSYAEIAREAGLSRQRIHQLIKKFQLKKLKKKQPIPLLTQRKNAFILSPEYYSGAAEKYRRKKVNTVRDKKWEFSIKFDEIPWVTHCPILGLELLYLSPFDRKMENSVSFDRIDPKRGYVKDNVKIISWRANRIKNDGTSEEHRQIAQYIDNH